MSNKLEELFGDILTVSEEQADKLYELIDCNDDDVKSITSGVEQKISFPSQVTQVSGRVKITHGPSGDDYIWHISCDRPRCSHQVFIYTIIKTMNTVIPQTTKVDVFAPAADWEIKEWTFAARGINNAWNVDEKDIKNLSLKLLESINLVAN